MLISASIHSLLANKAGWWLHPLVTFGSEIEKVSEIVHVTLRLENKAFKSVQDADLETEKE